MKIIQLSQGLVTAVDDCDWDYLNRWEWYAGTSPSHTGFYAQRNYEYANGSIIKMHKVIAERLGLVGTIDHKDRITLNNQRFNLRQATSLQNIANTGLRSTNKSGYKGVSFYKRNKKWVAQICIEGRKVNLGYFDCPIKAAKAYDHAALRQFGEFAVLNFPA